MGLKLLNNLSYVGLTTMNLLEGKHGFLLDEIYRKQTARGVNSVTSKEKHRNTSFGWIAELGYEGRASLPLQMEHQMAGT